MIRFTESIIEQAAIDWLQSLGYAYAFGPDLVCRWRHRTLASLCDALLPKLMRGEARVKM